MRLVQGEVPAPVDASPVLCNPGGRPSGRYANDAEQWYFGKEGCRLAYPPRPDALVSSLSEAGWKESFFARSAAPSRLVALLKELEGLVREGKLSLQERLMVQTTAWEVADGLKRFSKKDAELATLVAPVFDATMRLLGLTLFKPAEVNGFPSTLADLAERAGAPEIAPTLKRILAGDASVVEVVSPSELHADLLFGRFAARLFLTIDDDEERTRLAAYLRDPATPYDDLRNLPLAFSGLRGILVLYLNALTEGFTIAPTEQVAFWQEYTFSAKTSFELSFDEMAKQISFLSVACEYAERPAGGAGGRPDVELACRKLDQDGMARRAFLDVKPVIADDRVTSLRGHCLRCHRNQVASFDTHGRRLVEFSAPLARRGRELLTPFYIERVEGKLREWERERASSAAR